MKTTKISFFDSIYKETKKDITFEQYVKYVKKGIDKKHAALVKTLVGYIKQDKISLYKSAKTDCPAITPSSLITGKREDKNVGSHTGIISIDIDSKNNSDYAIKNFNDPAALAYHKSLSGLGLVIYYRIDGELHREAFIQLGEYLKTKYGLNYDRATGSISQFRYVAIDPHIVVNWTAPVFEVIPLVSSEIVNVDNSTDRKDDLINLCNQIIKEKLDLVSDYADWIKVGLMIRDTFKDDPQGFELFNNISKCSAGYKSKADCKKKYDSFAKSRPIEKPATVGSLVYMMKQSGAEVKPIEMSIKGFKTIKQRKKEEQAGWKSYLVTEQPPDDIVLVEFGGVPVCTAGNHTLLVGKKKARKSLLISWMISQYCDQANLVKDILLTDTEQGLTHVWKARERVKRITGKHINVLSLRGESPKIRKRIIEMALEEMKPKMIFIDGIRDLVSDINDPVESTNIVTWLEMLTVETGIHIVDVLHLNKTDNNARGHLGSELLNKAETTIEVTLHKTQDLTLVTCESSRGIPFDDFAFTHDLKGLPTIVDLPSTEKQIKGMNPESAELLSKLFTDYGPEIEPKNLFQLLADNLPDVGIATARKLVSRFSSLGWIIPTKTAMSKYQTYKLGSTKNAVK